MLLERNIRHLGGRFMLKLISKNDVSIAVDFAWKLSRNLETSSYPLYNEKSKLEENFEGSFLKDNNILLGYYKNNKLIAIIQFFFIQSEKYIQTTGIYISTNYNEVMDKLISMLKNEYNTYRALFGFPKENIKANDYFIKNRYECIDSCLDMRLSTVNFKGCKYSNNIFNICKSNFDTYAAYHDKYFQRTYWTSRRLRETLYNWRIFVYRPEDSIEGSIFIKECDKNTMEIFGLSVSDKYKGKDVEELLLSQGLYKLFKDKPSIEKTIFFIDDIDIKKIQIAEKVGFNYFNSYRCYQVWL